MKLTIKWSQLFLILKMEREALPFYSLIRAKLPRLSHYIDH